MTEPAGQLDGGPLNAPALRGERGGTGPDGRGPDWIGADEGAEDRLSKVLEGASRGDEQAWRALAGLYGRRVFALARSRLRNDDMAEEITQSVFATLAIKMRDGSYTERGRFEPWLFRIVMNRVRDEVRKLGSRPGMVGPDALEHHVGTGSGNDMTAGAASVALAHASRQQQARELGLLRRAIERLSDADREVIELRHQAGLSFGAMSAMLEEPLGTLLARHHRALRKLKEHLGAMGMKCMGPAEPEEIERDDDRGDRRA